VNIYVGNLAYSVGDDQLSNMFSKFGTVSSARVVQDQFSGRSKGFGFVEMESEEDAKRAIAELDNQDFDGRAIKVNEARPKEERSERRGPPRNGGGQGRGPGGGGAGGGRRDGGGEGFRGGRGGGDRDRNDRGGRNYR
jgi:RNA recognition motif-containing protein